MAVRVTFGVFLAHHQLFVLGIVDKVYIVLDSFVLRHKANAVHKFAPPSPFYVIVKWLTVETEIGMHRSYFRIKFLLQVLTTSLVVVKFIQISVFFSRLRIQHHHFSHSLTDRTSQLDLCGCPVGLRVFVCCWRAWTDGDVHITFRNKTIKGSRILISRSCRVIRRS